MKLPDKFKFGRFRLESVFVVSDYHDGRFCKIIINGFEMTTGVRKKQFQNVNTEDADNLAEEVKESLAKGDSIHVVFNMDAYTVRIEDKTWVCMERDWK